eukprot:2919964-Rhodomonas_salina.4
MSWRSWIRRSTMHSWKEGFREQGESGGRFGCTASEGETADRVWHAQACDPQGRGAQSNGAHACRARKVLIQVQRARRGQGKTCSRTGLFCASTRARIYCYGGAIHAGFRSTHGEFAFVVAAERDSSKAKGAGGVLRQSEVAADSNQHCAQKAR